MKLVYHCYGGAHTSVTCASIHLKYLPNDRMPKVQEFKNVPFYDKMDNDKLGTPVYVGRDEFGIDIYIMGMKNSSSILIPAINSYLNHCGGLNKDIVFVNALVELHPMTSIGGFTSRKLGILSIGRPMTILGIQKSYPRFLDVVSNVKENLKARRDNS